MRGAALRFHLQPQTALVRGDTLQFRRFTDNRQIRLKPARRQRARTGLRIFFINHRR